MSRSSQSTIPTDGSTAGRLKAVNKQIFPALLGLASAALLIRVMGMLYQVVVTARFGAGAAMDAYFVASMLPTSMAQLVISAIEASTIPVYARVRTEGGKKQASALFSTGLNILLVGTVLLTGVMLLFSRQIIILSAPGLDLFRVGLASSLAPFIFPVFVLTVVIGFIECVLNTEGQFGLPAYAGMLVPLTTAVLVLIVGKSLGVVALCIGMVIGLCLQLVVFILRVRRAGLTYRPTIDLRNSEISSMLVVAGPALLSAFLLGQANPLVDQIFASSLPAGSISAINYSLKLVSVPSGVIFTSIGRVILPHLSRQASRNDMKAFKGTLRLYFWVLGIGTTLLAALMILLAHPIVQILFQRGAFTANVTDRTAITLVGFLLGLTPLGLSFLTTKAFSALGKTQILMRVSVFSMIANAVFDYIFARWWQSFGIALATSAVYFCAVIIQFSILQHMIGKLDLFTPPREVLDVIRKLRVSPYYVQWVVWRKEHLPSFPTPSNVRRQIMRVGVSIAVFAAAVAGVILNPLNTLRAALASVVMLVLLRYRYALLIGWLFLNALNSLPNFRGSNVLVGLTVPTLLLMAYLPIKQTFKRMPALAFLSIYLLWVFAGIVIPNMEIGSFLKSWTLLLDCATIAVLTINVLTTRRRLMGLIDAILLLSLFIALYGIYGYITKQNGAFEDTSNSFLFRIGSIFGDSATTLAIYLSAVIPLALYRSLTLRGFKRAGSLIVAFVLLVALGLTFTRSAFISLPLSIIIMILFLPSRKMKAGLLSGFLALALLTVLLAAVGNLPLFSRFFQQDITSLNGRTYLWQALLDHFDPTQLLGNGLHASVNLLTNLVVRDSHGVVGNAPHSLFLATLYDHGIIGAILLTSVFIVLIVGIIAGMRKATDDHRMLFVTILAVLVCVLLQSIESNNFWDPEFSIYFWVIIALPFALCWSTPKQPPKIDQEILDEVTISQRKAVH